MIAVVDEDDEAENFGAYENGHWEWSDETNSLVFRSDLPQTEEVFVLESKVVGLFEFKDDIDIMEQQRFRKRYQRKPQHGVQDYVFLQDVKDVVLYTAPPAVVTPAVVNLLHLPVFERFLRALILFSQYYLQITDTMTMRTMELEVKVPTPDSLKVEAEFRENLQDLRLLVAKEYSTILHGDKNLTLEVMKIQLMAIMLLMSVLFMLEGGEGTGKFHHMGKTKKRRSLSRKDAILIETLLRISIQIVWIALGRKSFNLIDVEIHRIFKSEIYNSVEHKLKTNYIQNMTSSQKMVLLGYSRLADQKLCLKSPLMKEVVRNDTDYRMFGLGVVKYHLLPHRLRYMERAISAPEELLEDMGVTVGIIGMSRSKFDTMLLEIKSGNAGVSSTSQSTSRASISRSRSSRASKTSQSPKSKHASCLLPYIDLPSKQDKDHEVVFESVFPRDSLPERPCSQLQRKKWLDRVHRLMGKAAQARKQ